MNKQNLNNNAQYLLRVNNLNINIYWASPKYKIDNWGWAQQAGR